MDDKKSQISNKKKLFNKNLFQGKGFYIALGICLVSIGLAAFSTYDSIQNFSSSPEELSLTSDAKPQVQTPIVIPTPEEKKDSANDSTVKQAEPKKDPAPAKYPSKKTEAITTPVTPVATKKADIVYPVGKKVAKEFSGDNPVYSKTLNDWRVHGGVDLQAEKGSKVKAVTNGKVKSILDDPMFGMTIIIEHDNGIVAHYCGLGNTTLVKVGAKVEPYTEIGSINDIPSESADGPHLHLIMQRNGKAINPIDILENKN